MKSLKIWLVNVPNWQVVEHCGDIALAREVQKLYGAGWDICTSECPTKYPDGVIFMNGVLYSTKQPKQDFMTKARKINVVVWFTIAIVVIAGVLTEWSKQSADGLEWSQVIACTVAYTLFSVALWACVDEIIKDFQK